MSGRVIRLPWSRIRHPKAGLIFQSAELDGERGVVVVQIKEGDDRKAVIAAAAVDVTTGAYRSKQVVEVSRDKSGPAVAKHKVRLAHLLRRKYWRRIGRPLSGGVAKSSRWLSNRPQSPAIAAIIAMDDERTASPAKPARSRRVAAAVAPVADEPRDFTGYRDHASGGAAACEAAF